MEYREAQNILSQLLKNACIKERMALFLTPTIFKCFQTAVIAVNRRISIPPKKEEIGGNGLWLSSDMKFPDTAKTVQLRCPNCKKPLITYLNGVIVHGAKTPCCPECGQAIDYGENR